MVPRPIPRRIRSGRGTVRALLLRSAADVELRERLSAFNRRLADQAERAAAVIDPLEDRAVDGALTEAERGR